MRARFEPNGWSAKSHRALRAPARNPVVNKLEGISTVGIVPGLERLAREPRLPAGSCRR